MGFMPANVHFLGTAVSKPGFHLSNPAGGLSIIRKPANSKLRASRAKSREQQPPIGRAGFADRANPVRLAVYSQEISALCAWPGIAEAVSGRPGVVWIQRVLMGARNPGASGDGRKNCGFSIDIGFRVDHAVKPGIDNGASLKRLADREFAADM